MKQLKLLTDRIASRFIRPAPQGKHGDYVPHFVINQKALAIVGPHSFEVVELIRGRIDAWVDKKTGEVKREARPDGVVGVVAKLTAVIDGRTVSIAEVGTEDNPQLESDAENAKKAASDAYKRCWMRLGLGLHLWSGSDYELPEMLAHYEKELG
ncbi:MAG TPA: hypothetical protein VH681_02670 [Nitrospiraceae bacterium]